MKNIGDTIYWVESHTRYDKAIPCPMCFGKRFVTIILGDDSRTESICGMCSHGLEVATGQAKTWEAEAIIKSGKITGISTRDGIKYEIGHQTVEARECFSYESDAHPVRERKLKEAQAQRDEWFRDNFIQCKKNQLWSAGYHRDQVKYHERQIEWHKMRLGMCKKPTPDQESG